MEEEKKEEQAETQSETAHEEEQGESTPTLDSIAKQNKELNDKLEKVLKQNSDKDSFISKLQGENRILRDTVEKVTTTLGGKSEKQKDAILDAHRERLVSKGYDAETVDLLLGTIVDLADRKAQEKIVPIIMEAAEELVESDAEIDKSFLEKNQDAISAEYGLFRPETSPRKIKANLKKAYKIVKERLAEAAKAPADDSREKMLAGGRSEPRGKDKTPQGDDLVSAIEKSGSGGSHFI